MLRTSTLLGVSVLLLSPALSEPLPVVPQDIQQYAPFAPPYGINAPIFLVKRAGCPSGSKSCSNINASDVCCASDTVCTHDQQGNVACCPVNNYCTGVIGSAPTSSGATSPTSNGTPAGGITVTVTSTAGVTGTPQSSQTTPASITGVVAGGGSTVQNAYYPYTYMPTSFANAAVCSSYYTSCQAASTSCFQSVGGVNGVTIGGASGGTTQVGNSGIIQASASSICSSLSQKACLGLQSTQCSIFGSTGATVSGFVQPGMGPRETGRPGMVYVAAAGAVIGAMGMIA